MATCDTLILMYGFNESVVNEILHQHNNTTVKLYIIEPRKSIIDKIRSSHIYHKHPSIVLVPKGLIKENIYKEVKLSSIIPFVDSNNEKCFCTSLCEIIVSYNLERIDTLIFNIVPTNVHQVLNNALPFTNIIKAVDFTNELTCPDCDFLKNFEQKEPRLFVNNFFKYSQVHRLHNIFTNTFLPVLFSSMYSSNALLHNI